MAGAWRQWSSGQVAEWLSSVGFAQHADIFRSNDIAGDILPELTNEVLRDDLGIAAFGHRARILNAVKALMAGDTTPSPRPPLAPRASSSSDTDSVAPLPIDTAPTATTNAKSALDLVVLHAAPLVIRDGKRLYTMEKLDLEAERRAITNSLLTDIRDKAIHVQFEIATADILRRVMTASTCRVLHFSGHGLGTKPALCFEDGLGCTHLVTPEILRDLTFTGSNGVSQTQLVFVNSCHSENVAKVFLEAGIPHVVAVHSDSLVVDASATMFAKHFYLSLFSGHTVQAAFNVARAFVRTLPSPHRGVCCCAHLHEPDCTWRQAGSRHSHHSPNQCCCKGSTLRFPHDESSKFLLLGDGDGSANAHEVVLFGSIPPGKLIDHTFQPKAIIPSLHGQFIGRGIETYMLVKSLRDNAVTTCIGAPGIGKSSLVISVGHFAHSRRMFRDGIFYVDLEGQKLSAVRYSIAQCMGIAAADTDEEVFAEIGSRQCLIILDKAEELLDEDEVKTQQFLSRMIALAPRARLLLGSRRVPHIPNVTCYSLSLQQLPTHLAVDLLCLMAPSCPTDAAKRLAQLCGCLPLAIRIIGRALANARSTVTPQQMIEHLEGDENRLETMKELNQVGQRECVDRCIRSSYTHLEEPLRLAFMALGFFRGSFDVAAVEAVLDSIPSSGMLTARSIAHSSSSSSSSASSPFSSFTLSRAKNKTIDDDLESTTGLGTKLAEADGFTNENDGVFTREAYNLLDFESPEEAQARTVAVASAADALKLLHQWSLVEYDAGAKRYRMHNLIQLFAEEEATQLGEPGNSDRDPLPTAGQGLGKEIVLTWRRRFIRHYCVVVANASHSYRYDGDLSLFDRERANIESAMRIGRLLTLQSIDRMREMRRKVEDARIERELEVPGFSAGENSAETSLEPSTCSELFGKSALVDVLIYCNLVTRSRFIFRTRIEPKRRLQFLSSCLQMARETRSLYCTCGCSENDPANLLWDIEEVKHDRPLGMLDDMPTFDEAVLPKESQLDCSCPGIKELIGLEILLLIDLGYASCDSADWIASEYYYLEVLRLQRDVLGWGENGQVAEVLNQFGICLSSGWGCMAYNVWLLRHAERLLLGALKVRRRVLGENHPDYATSLNNVANFYKNSNPNKKETTSHRPRRRRSQTDEDSETSSTVETDSGSVSTTSTLSEEARNSFPGYDYLDVEALYRRSLRIREATLGKNHPHVAQSLNNLALALITKIQPQQMMHVKNASILSEVNELYARALRIRRSALGNSSFETAATLNNIGNLRRLQGDWKSAEEYIREALRVINRFDSDHSPRAARMYINLARLQRDQKRYDEAIIAYQTACDIRQKWFPGSRDVGYCKEQIGKCMVLKGSEDEGRALEAEGRRMKKLGVAAIPDATIRSPRNDNGNESSPFMVLSLKIVDIIPPEVISSRKFNFPGKLLGERGVHMKRIDAITCANVRYQGPWPSALAKLTWSEQDQLVTQAEIQITAATDVAMQRAKDHCVAHLLAIAADFQHFSQQNRERRESASTSN